MWNHATTNYTPRMVGHRWRTSHRPFKGHGHLRMAENTYKCQTSVKDHGSLGIPKALHPRLRSNCQTNCGAHKEGHTIWMDGRVTTGTWDTYLKGHNCPGTGIPWLRATIWDGSRCFCLCGRSYSVSERWPRTKMRCWVILQGIKPSGTQLWHLGLRVLGGHQSTGQLASYTYWYPTQNHGVDGPWKLTILSSTTESE